MPNFNGTGPTGAGPMTGRGMGSCGGGYGYGRGFFGRCRGYGRRLFGWDNYRPASKEDVLSSLKDEKKYIEDDLNAINEEIKKTESAK